MEAPFARSEDEQAVLGLGMPAQQPHQAVVGTSSTELLSTWRTPPRAAASKALAWSSPARGSGEETTKARSAPARARSSAARSSRSPVTSSTPSGTGLPGAGEDTDLLP